MIPNDYLPSTPLSLKSALIRFLVIGCFFVFVAGIIHVSVALGQMASEGSLIEKMQLLFLAISITTFIIIAWRYSYYQQAASLIAAFLFCLAIRELDGILDIVFHGFWAYPAWLVAIVSIGMALKKRQKTYHGLLAVVNARSFNVMLIGISILMVFSRLYGMSDLWTPVMGNMFVTDVKNISEEGIELLAYSLICLASISYWIEITQHHKQVSFEASK